jgi:predicted transcriptional regulator
MIGEVVLIVPCEIAVKSVIPAVKAMLARELVEKRSLKQDEVAEILGISQSAVSKYNRKARGYVIRADGLEEIEPLVGKMINVLVDETSERGTFLRFFCQTCVAIRKAKLMCPFCQKTDPTPEVKECSFCLV